MAPLLVPSLFLAQVSRPIYGFCRLNLFDPGFPSTLERFFVQRVRQVWQPYTPLSFSVNLFSSAHAMWSLRIYKHQSCSPPSSCPGFLLLHVCSPFTNLSVSLFSFLWSERTRPPAQLCPFFFPPFLFFPPLHGPPIRRHFKFRYLLKKRPDSNAEGDRTPCSNQPFSPFPRRTPYACGFLLRECSFALTSPHSACCSAVSAMVYFFPSKERSFFFLDSFFQTVSLPFPESFSPGATRPSPNHFSANVSPLQFLMGAQMPSFLQVRRFLFPPYHGNSLMESVQSMVVSSPPPSPPFLCRHF